MDVVIFRLLKSDGGDDADQLEFGAVQEFGTIAPIVTWTLDSVMANSDTLEFLVDEERPRYPESEVEVVSVFPENVIGYGSRQVGGGKGPGNPHGEESEALYYLERSAVEEGCAESVGKLEVVVKPELEIMW